MEAAAWFALAAVILAWGRSRRQPAAEREEPPGDGSWRSILWRTWRAYHADRVGAVAAGVTFFSLMALFPAIAAFVALYGLFLDVSAAREQLGLLAGFLPGDVLAFVGDQMIRLADLNNGGLGLAFTASLALSMWSANAGVRALLDGLNVAFGQGRPRNFLQANLVALAFTAGAIGLVALILTLAVVLPLGLALFGYGGPNPVWLLRWPLLVALLVLSLELLFRFGVRGRRRFRWISWGSAAGGLAWVAASMALSGYVGAAAYFDRTYGSLGAVVAIMTWMWIASSAVLVGAEINAQIEAAEAS